MLNFQMELSATAAVSYTHLSDLNGHSLLSNHLRKTEAEESAPVSHQLIIIIEIIITGVVIVIIIVVIIIGVVPIDIIIGAVSYTHLDVYKRQSIDRCGNRKIPGRLQSRIW